MPPAWVIEGMSYQHEFCTDNDVATNHTKSRSDFSDDEKTFDAADSFSDLSSVGVVNAGDAADSKVKFNLGATVVHKCLGRHEMTETYMRDIWYRQSDFASMSTFNRMTVKVFRQHEKQFGQECMDLGDECIRGLEHRLKGRHEARRELTVNAIYAVLGEQARRRRSGRLASDHGLAEIYLEHTRVAVALALEKATKDVDAARDTPVIEEQKSYSQMQEGRQRSGYFDDFDVATLGEDSPPVPVSTDSTESSPAGTAPTEEDVDESFRTKEKREKRGAISFSRFFKKKSSRSSVKSSKPPARNDSIPTSKRRRCRRSSM